MSRTPLPLALRFCLILLRICSALVPARWRADWRAEWDAEVRYRWQALDARHDLDWRSKMDLFRRAMGAVPDAAWLRRQFTADADIVHDLKHGARMLRKSPGFTAASVFILSLGIGGTVAIVSLLDTLMFHPLPYEDPDRIVTVWQRHAVRQLKEDVAPANFIEWRERARSFQSMAALIPYSFDYTGGGEPEVFFGAQVTEGFWDAIGMRPALGRTFLSEEHVRGGRRAVILSYGLWQRRFGGNQALINQPISLDNEPWIVVGILPKEFAPQLLPGPGELGVWTPKVIQDHERRTRGSAWWNVVGRLKPGVSVDEAQREMDTIAAALGREYPASNERVGVMLVSLRLHLMGGLRLPLLVMLAAVVAVLGIGCANVASLLLARGIQREREFAIRAALGAGRARLVRQLVAECLLLSMVSAIGGIGLAHFGIRAVVALAPGGVVRLQDASIDGRMLMVAAALSTLTALAFGLLPAWQFSRPARRALAERHTTGPRALVRRGLVTTEIALALVLLTGAGLLFRSFTQLLAVDPGFRPANAVALQVFASDRNGTPDRVRQFFSRTLDRIRALPGVQGAGAVSAMPFMLANIDIKTPLEIIGRDTPTDGAQRPTYITIATPGYFDAMGIPIREGRSLEERDAEHAPLVAVISDALRRREWPGQSPVGSRIRVRFEGKPKEAEIVGVVSEIRHDGLDRAPRAEIFVPLAQVPFASMTYVVRSSTRDAAALIQAVRREVWAVDPAQTFYDISTVQRLVDVSVIERRFSMTLLSALAALALLLCATGLYGVISFTTAQRTREIGVRMALGADAQTIRGMVLREGALIVATGVLVGLAGALTTTRFIQTLLFDVKTVDPLTFATVSSILILVSLAACYVPALRATRVDPLVALRVD